MRAVRYIDKEVGTAVGEVPDPSPAPDEVVVVVDACGLCGSDVHSVQNGNCQPGQILGHEFSGRIVALGAEVTGWAEGQAVAASPLGSCGKCRICMRGMPFRCLAAPNIGVSCQGAYAEYAAVPARQLVALPPELPVEIGSHAEPLSVGVAGGEAGPGRARRPGARVRGGPDRAVRDHGAAAGRGRADRRGWPVGGTPRGGRRRGRGRGDRHARDLGGVLRRAGGDEVRGGARVLGGAGGVQRGDLGPRAGRDRRRGRPDAGGGVAAPVRDPQRGAAPGGRLRVLRRDVPRVGRPPGGRPGARGAAGERAGVAG